MTEDEVVRPVGTTDLDPDLGSRTMVFRPRGFLVAILTDDDEARRGAAALRAAGFAGRELRISTGEQILADDDEAGRAVRGLSGCRTPHIRHRRSDVVLQRPTP
jgi:hypothetical protein